MLALSAFATRKAAAVALLQAASEAVAPLDQARADTLHTAAERARDAAFHVLLLGPFSSGKSSLLNALLSAPALPVRVNPCTALPTELRWGEARQATLVHTDGGEEALPVDTFLSDVRLSATGDDRWASVERAVLRWPLPLLNDGVVLVDTPGLDDDPRRTARTLRDLDRADAVILVSPSTRFLSPVELRVVAQELRPRGLHNVFLVGTMLDLVASLGEDAPALRERLTERAEGVLGPSSEAPGGERVWWVSGRAGLAARERGESTPALARFEAALADFLVNGRGAAWSSRWSSLVQQIQADLADQHARERAARAAGAEALVSTIEALAPKLAMLDATADRLGVIADHFVAAQRARVRESLHRMLLDAEAELPEVVAKLPLRRTAGLGWLTENGRTQIEAEVRAALEAWLDTRTRRWAHGLRGELDAQLAELKLAVAQETEAFDQALAELSAEVAQTGHFPDGPLLRPPPVAAGERWFALALGAALGSPGTVFAGWTEGYAGALKGATTRLAARVGLLAVGALLGPVGWAGIAVYALTDAVVVIMSGDAQRQVIRSQLTQALSGTLVAASDGWTQEVDAALTAALTPVRDGLVQAARAEATACRHALEQAATQAAASESSWLAREAQWVQAEVTLQTAAETLAP